MNIDHRVPISGAHFDHRRPCDAGIVDEAVQAAKAILRRINQGWAERGIGDIAAPGQQLLAAVQIRKALNVPVHRQHICAKPQRVGGDGFADTLRGAGHDHGLAGKGHAEFYLRNHE